MQVSNDPQRRRIIRSFCLFVVVHWFLLLLYRRTQKAEDGLGTSALGLLRNDKNMGPSYLKGQNLRSTSTIDNIVAGLPNLER